MDVVFRNGKEYLRGELTGIVNIMPREKSNLVRTSIDLWNKIFCVDYFSFRKKLRRISYDIVSSNKCIDKIYVYYDKRFYNNEKFLGRIYCPMDDDDIFIMSEQEYEMCVSEFNEKCNGVITGYYESKYRGRNKIVYRKNPGSWKVNSNNLIYRHTTKIAKHHNRPVYHTNASESPILKSKEMRHIETSFHITHPASLTVLNGADLPQRKMQPEDILIETEIQKKERVLKMVNEFITETGYREALPTKFIPHLEKFKELYSDLKMK